MRSNLFLASACVVAVAAGLAAQQAPAADPIKAAIDYLGVADMKSVRVTGFGAAYTVGQAPSAADPWPKVDIRGYEATYNFEQQALRTDITREMGPVPPRGGGPPFAGQQRQIQVVRGTFAWDEAVPAAAAGGGRRGGGPPPAAEAGRVTLNEVNLLVGIRPPGPPPPTPQPAAAMARMAQYWLLPHAFLKGAVDNKATTRKVGQNTEATFTVNNRKFVGIVNSRGEVEKVTTWVDDPVLGDMPVESVYSNYQVFVGGFRFPLRVVQTTGGYPSLELWLSSVTSNPENDTFNDPRLTRAEGAGTGLNANVPANVAAATVPPVNVTNQQIAPGVQWITGGSHHSVAIEMRDHVILVEAPQNEARVAPVIAKVKELFPNKPIRFVVNTHNHFDHAGGLRTAVAEGATVVTHQGNRAYYEKVWAAPREAARGACRRQLR